MTQVDEYKFPGENKDASTINNSEYHNSHGYKYEISDLDKKVEASKEPITDTRVSNTSVGIVSANPSAVGVRIIGLGVRGITQGMINGEQALLRTSSRISCGGCCIMIRLRPYIDSPINFRAR